MYGCTGMVLSPICREFGRATHDLSSITLPVTDFATDLPAIYSIVR